MHKALPRAEVLQKVPPPSPSAFPLGDTAHVRVSCSKEVLLGEHPIEKSLSQLPAEQDSRQSLRQGRGTALLPYPGQGGRRHRQSAVGSVNTLHSSPPITQCLMLMVELPWSTHCPNKASFFLQELQ